VPRVAIGTSTRNGLGSETDVSRKIMESENNNSALHLKHAFPVGNAEYNVNPKSTFSVLYFLARHSHMRTVHDAAPMSVYAHGTKYLSVVDGRGQSAFNI
jgi:hypothetical protein